MASLTPREAGCRWGIAAIRGVTRYTLSDPPFVFPAVNAVGSTVTGNAESSGRVKHRTVGRGRTGNHRPILIDANLATGILVNRDSIPGIDQEISADAF